MIRRALKLFRKLIRYWRLRQDPVGYARSIGVQVGNDCRLLGLQLGTFGSEPFLVSLGNHVTITGGVQFITHDGGVWIFRDRHPDIDIIAPIVIGNNVFVGLNAILMPGVTVGDNCIIGAGAVVTRDIPAGHVAAGVPARCIQSIDEYWEKVQRRALHIRSLPEAEKRAFLEKKFGRGQVQPGCTVGLGEHV
jgi:acyl-[acyl carrier protein]--UDP-N-acetylglucosamine O-acyltransferase